MMHDLLFVKNEDGWPDLFLENGDFKFDEGLETSSLISSFTDGLVQAEDLPEKERDRRGWWADLVSEPIEDQIGSRLWLVFRGKVSQNIVNRISDLTREAFQWMIDDGVAQGVNVTAEINAVDPERVDIRVEIFQPDEDNFFFKFVWTGQEQVAFG
jgi:phage gp46-like protein